MNSASSTPVTNSSAPAYPAAPWRLRGWAFQSLHLVNINAVRPLVPPGLRVLRVSPRHTLGCVYIANYGTGSVLQYHELIVLPALVWGAGRLGFWVSHIYVDDRSSMAGGREVWNLPKEMAEFTVNDGVGDRQISVQQNGTSLVTIEYKPARAGVPFPMPLPAFGTLNGAPRFFVGRARSHLGLARASLQIPAESPFTRLGLGRPFKGLSYASLDLLAAAPK